MFIALVFAMLSPYLRPSQSLPLPEPSFNMDSGPRRQFRAEQVEEGPNMRKFLLQESFGSISVGESREGERQSSSATSWRTLTFKQVAELWRNSTEFTEVFVDSISSAPFDAFFWESKPVTKSTMVSPVLIEAPDTIAPVPRGGNLLRHMHCDGR